MSKGKSAKPPLQNFFGNVATEGGDLDLQSSPPEGRWWTTAGVFTSRGALISGIAVALKEQRPRIRVYRVDPEHANTFSEALHHKRPFPLARVETIADGLAAGITEDLNFSIVSHYVNSVIVVDDGKIIEAMLFLLEHAKAFGEPSAAASFAGMLANS